MYGGLASSDPLTATLGTWLKVRSRDRDRGRGKGRGRGRGRGKFEAPG